MEKYSQNSRPPRARWRLLPYKAECWVIRRSPHVIAPLTYCFPGGGIEDGETEEIAVVREVREEIGIVIRPRRRLWECVTAWKVHLAWWLADMDSAAVAVPNPREVESIHWFTPREMASLPELLDSNRASSWNCSKTERSGWRRETD